MPMAVTRDAALQRSRPISCAPTRVEPEPQNGLRWVCARSSRTAVTVVRRSDHRRILAVRLEDLTVVGQVLFHAATRDIRAGDGHGRRTRDHFGSVPTVLGVQGGHADALDQGVKGCESLEEGLFESGLRVDHRFRSRKRTLPPGGTRITCNAPWTSWGVPAKAEQANAGVPNAAIAATAARLFKAGMIVPSKFV
jgi:hypothetical protein